MVAPLSTVKVEPDKILKLLAVNLRSSAPAILISIWSSVSAVIEVSASASSFNSVPFISKPPVNVCSVDRKEDGTYYWQHCRKNADDDIFVDADGIQLELLGDPILSKDFVMKSIYSV